MKTTIKTALLTLIGFWSAILLYGGLTAWTGRPSWAEWVHDWGSVVVLCAQSFMMLFLISKLKDRK